MRSIFAASPCQPKINLLHHVQKTLHFKFSCTIKMADPLSGAASALTLLGFSLSSCQFLLDLFLKAANAASEIQQHILWLQALHSTFTQLHELGNNPNHRDILALLPPDFNDCLREANVDLQFMEVRARKINNDLTKRGAVHPWNKLKYAILADKHLSRLSERLQRYHAKFTIDLLTAQM